MQKIFSAFVRILIGIYVLATFIPIYALISDFIRIPGLKLILALFVACIPIVNCIVGIIGAVQIWNLSILSAVLFYIAPIVIMYVIAFLYSMPKKH